VTDQRTILIFGGKGDTFDLLDEKQKIALPVEELRKNLESFMSSLEEILSAADKPAAGMGLKGINVAVGINGKGQIGFLGTGAELGGSATLTLNFQKG